MGCIMHDMSERAVTISVVIPVYQAEACLHELHERLTSVLRTLGPDYEIVLVEDRGQDRSWEVIREIAGKDPRVKAARLSRNFGQHHAIAAGLDMCKGEWVVIMDCDLQDRPEEIPRLYEKALSGHDIVLARRAERQDGVVKRLFSKTFYAVLSYLTETRMDPSIGSFRIMSRKVVRELSKMHEQTRFFGGLVNWLGFSSTTVDVEHAPRMHGKTSYNLKKLVRLAVGAILAFSDKPLRLAVQLGFLISFLSMCFGVYAVITKLMHPSVQLGWTSLIVSIYFMGGLVIGVIGICGLYIGKIFEEVKRRPLYVIDEKINAD